MMDDGLEEIGLLRACQWEYQVKKVHGWNGYQLIVVDSGVLRVCPNNLIKNIH